MIKKTSSLESTRILFGSNSNGDYKDNYIANIERSFFLNPSYVQITKNDDYDTKYDTWIYNGNISKKLVGTKSIKMYPNQDLNVGDYINWKYGGEDTRWLVTSVDKQYDFDIKGTIHKTNNDLKYVDRFGKIQSVRCVVLNSFNYTNFEFSKGIVMPEGDITCLVQANDVTRNISINQRFLFNGQAFKVNAIKDFISNEIFDLSMFKDNLASDDDVVNNVANTNRYKYTLSINQSNIEQTVGYTAQLSATLKLNNQIVNESIEWISSDSSIVSIDSLGNIELLSEGSCTITARMLENQLISDSISINVVAIPSGNESIEISPNVTKILKSSTQQYEVYKYLDGVQQVDTFTITGSNVPDGYYNLNIIDGNTFEVTNIERYLDGDLIIDCISNVDGDNSSISIQLGGLF